MKIFRNLVLILCLSFSAPSLLIAEIIMPPIFSDHMVLQRDLPIPIWGKASQQVEVSIRLGGNVYSTISSSQGDWKVLLPAIDAGGPHQLTITSEKEKLVFNDVLIGEVWICSGQSNMQFELKQSDGAQVEIPTSRNPNIRLFKMQGRHNLGAVAFSESEMKWLERGEFMNVNSWLQCSPESASNFSAVAYHFGRMLYDSLRVPIGLVQNAIGGSPIEAWLDQDVINSDPNMRHLKENEWYHNPDVHPWVSSRVQQNLQPWLESGDSAKGLVHPFAPGYLFNCGIKPLAPFSIRGVLWYQGESNASSPKFYAKLFESMVDSWRSTFNQANLPFLFVQLPKIGNRSRWPEFRAQQEECLSIANTGMVVTIDQGHITDVHPNEKMVVGKRLAGLALKTVYGFSLYAISPRISSFEWNENEKEIKIKFTDVGDGLVVHKSDAAQGFVISGYSTDGGDKRVVLPKRTMIAGDSISLSYGEKFIPTTVTYAWAPFPENNIVNSAELPLAPFKIELVGNN